MALSLQNPKQQQSTPGAGNASTGPSSTASGSSSASGQSNSMRQDQLNASMAPSQQGSATVVGAAANSEWAFDNSFTPALVAQLNNNPNMSLDEVLAVMGDTTLNSGSPTQPQHHATIARYGQTDANSNECRAGEHKAVLIANQNYNNIGNLNTPIAEANSMAGSLRSRGYDTNVLQDQNAKEMGSAWNTMVRDATEGDDVVAFYGGHGAEEGLVGVDYSAQNNDIFSNGQVSSVVSTATGKGAHIRFIMDSCHSGSAVQEVRENRLAELSANASGLGEQLYVYAAQTCQEIKQELLKIVADRAALLGNFDAQIRQLANSPPANSTPQQVQVAIAVLRATKAAAQVAFDAKTAKAWTLYSATLSVVATALAGASGQKVDPPPAVVSDYRTLGAQLDACDRLENLAMEPVDRRLSEDDS